jgi:hypothetical protein
MTCGFQSMTSQIKYDACLALLSEIHDIAHVMIESGVDADLTAFQLIEEAIKVLKSVETEPIANMNCFVAPEKKEKKIVH